MQTHWEWLLTGRGGRALPVAIRSPGETERSVGELRETLLAENRIADEAERVGAAYQLGRLGRDSHSKEGQAALEALMDALQGSHAQAPRRVAVPGLASAGSAAVEALCHTLTTSTEDSVLMFAAEALADAVPRDDTVGAAQSATALAVAVERLEAMVEDSPRLQGKGLLSRFCASY
eukprot:SAG31_NODE_729_length_12511_cov_7.059293_3_plen_177_part_00